MNKLDAKLKVKWVKALRSGKFEQGSGRLCIYNRYCCLGVLAKVADFTSSSGSYLENNRHKDVFLPDKVQGGLASLNDDGIPFDLIAGFIQENL